MGSYDSEFGTGAFWLLSLFIVRKGRAGLTLTMSVSPLFCQAS
jgi:hypothetical protein